ncbi:MAG: hypothetical protein ACHP6I_02465 [Rickettsiales bacterium]
MRNKIKPSYQSRLQHEIEKSLTTTIDKRFLALKKDLNNLILGMSSQMHSRNISNASNNLWKSFSSENQAITAIGNALQKALLRNL